MKKSIILFGSLLCFALSAKAQSFDTTNFYGKMNYLYANINKAPITTGLLREYGIDFQNLDLYTGTNLHDSNFASLTDWRMLYGSIYSQQINSTAGLLYLDSLNNKFNQHIAITDPIGFVTMYYHYQSIDPNGVNNNQFYLSNHQLFDVNGRSGNPYLTNDIFAIATTRQTAFTGANQFIFSNDLFFGNTGKTISNIQVDALGNGSYQTVYMGTAFTVNYNTPGLYSVNIQITYTDNTVKYAHTKLAVHAAPSNNQARFGTGFTPANKEPVTATKPYLGILGKGDITIDLAQNNTTGQIRKPLIVVEGFDPDDSFEFDTRGGFITRINQDINYDIFTPITLNTGLDNINEYDLIFLDWANGTDHIQRNAYLLERVIEIVNSHKTTWNGVRQDNIIIGMSMGGLVARYALRDMELNNIPHQTRLFISQDVPHNGANVPVAYQAMVQYIAPWKMVNIGGNFPFIAWEHLFPDAVNAVQTFNSPAAKQMLIQRYTLVPSGGIISPLVYNLEADNTTHQAFMAEINSMGWPSNCKNITLANGACNGAVQFADNSKLLSIYGEQSWTYFGSLWRSIAASLAGVSNIPYLSTMGSVPVKLKSLITQAPLALASTKTNLFFDFGAWSVPTSSNSIVFQGDVYIQRKLFFGLFTTNSYLLKCHANSTAEMLAIDNAPGGVYDLNEFGFNADIINQQLQLSLGNWISATVHKPKFCFVPTVSALAFNNPTPYYRSAVCDYINCQNPAQVAGYYAPQQNQFHISYTQANADWILQNQDPNFSCAKICRDQISIGGDALVCSASGLYTLNNLPPPYSISWSATPAGIVDINASGNEAVLTKIIDGAITLTATINNPCGGVPIHLNKPVYFGNPVPFIYFENEDPICINMRAPRGIKKVSIINPNPHANYRWKVNGNIKSIGQTDMDIISNWCVSGTNRVEVESFSCGFWNPSGTLEFEAVWCNNFNNRMSNYTIMPNPVQQELIIAQKKDGFVNHEKIKEIKEIQIIDKFGAILYQQKYSKPKKELNIPVAQWHKDIYYIRIWDGSAWESLQFVKE